MAGCKALTETEVSLVSAQLKSHRDKTLFILGLRTGFRISELLSLSIQDVYNKSEVVVHKRNMKGKVRSRVVPLHPQAKQYIATLCSTLLLTQPITSPLFSSLANPTKAISRVQAHIILKQAYKQANIEGRTGTHCMRKTFAKRVHKALDNDLVKTCKALGHVNINSTVNYLEVFKEEIDSAILSA